MMGSRRSDPHCSELKKFSPTDSHYPNLMRINPIIDWSYDDVWNYIIKNQLKVCSLYEHGYTSIGNRLNTFPNFIYLIVL